MIADFAAIRKRRNVPALIFALVFTVGHKTRSLGTEEILTMGLSHCITLSYNDCAEWIT